MELHKKGGHLCWVARWVTLASLVGTPVAAYAHALTNSTYPYDPTWYLVLLLWLSPVVWVGPFYIAVLPSLIAWRRHLLGGAIIVVTAIAYIWLIWLGPVRSWGGTETLTAYLLPLCGLFCAGGVLHLLAWLKERVPCRGN